MNRRKELLALVIADFLAINGAWFLFYWVRVQTGLFRVAHDTQIGPGYMPSASLLIYLFWLLAFSFFGLYRSWYVRAPSDEVITLLKTLTIGSIFLAVFIFWDPISGDSSPIRNDPRVLALVYWLILVIIVIGVRSLIRFGQRLLLEKGVGRRTSVVIGPVDRASDLAHRVAHYPRLGYDVIGIVLPFGVESTNGNGHIAQSVGANVRKHSIATHSSVPVLGSTAQLERLIDEHNVKEVLIALDSDQHDALLDVMARASKSNAGLKIEPGLYDIVTGQARAREIYGFPLLDINPVLLRPWEEAAKRMLDIVVSALVLVLGSPFWILTALAVKLTSRGPALYSQERVGKDGRHYRMYKFRSMRVNAETGGPQWASKNDPRVTPIGRFLRKSHLDEVPQFWNVLIGEMSLVGPRPEREFFVRQLVEEIPYYNRRHKVRPGITGLYQATIDKYDENLDDVRMRVKYDLMYIESMSFRLDVKILFRTAYMMLKARGQA